MSAMPYSSVLASLMTSLKAPTIAGGGAWGNMLNQANQANSQRGQAILALLDQQGKSQMAGNEETFQRQVGSIDQDMMSRGIYNTSVGSNLKQQAYSQLMNANQDVSERAASNLANMANSFSQRAPDMGMLAQLMGAGGSGVSGQIVAGPNAFDPIFGLRPVGLR